jgi:DNA repair protein RadA/Sms
VDSIQTLTSDSLNGIAGSVGQVRLGAQVVSQTAKRLHTPLILVGHVTKDGTVAGPKVLEHLVDTVLYLEGDSQHLFRLLKTTKNRFGAVSEVGMFEMRDNGLIEVINPSEVFLNTTNKGIPGSCVTVVMEGYRPLLFEIQALTTKTAFGYPRRTTSGFNVNRLQVLIAILEKRANLNLSSHDVYINVAGGFKVSEYGADLAVCLAIASSLKNIPLKLGVAAFGECGLLGEVRRVSNDKARIKEAKKMGYETVLSPDFVGNISKALKLGFN